MERILAKTIISLVIGFTVGLLTGYTINYKTYSWNKIQVSEERLSKEIDIRIADNIHARNRDYEENVYTSYPREKADELAKIHREQNKPTEKVIIDWKTKLWQDHTLKKFNYKVALLSGSFTVTILIVLLLDSELKKKAK